MFDLRRKLFVAPIVAVLALVGTSTPASADDPPGPVTPLWTAALLYSVPLNPNANTPGANDYSCVPSAAHPRPVVLVHGTFENRYDDWAWMAPQIKAAGYCVFALNFGDETDTVPGLIPGIYGTSDIGQSAKELAVFVDDVLVATGAGKVDLIGHSQGGMMPRQYLKFEGGQGKVQNLITFGATHHGTTLVGIGTLANLIGLTTGLSPVLGRASVQQVVGSDFLTTLNAGGDTVPGVTYTVVATRFDLVSSPPQASFLAAGPGATVRNIWLQSGCLLDLSSHTSMMTSNRAIDIALNALDPAHPRPLRCELHLPEV